MPVGDVIQAKLFTQMGSQMGLMIFHYRISAVVAPEPTILQTATQIDVDFAPFIKADIVSAARYVGATAQKVRPLPRGIEVFSGTQAGLGTLGGDPLPAQVSGIITLRTALAGRKNRGRKYVPFGPETANDDGFTPNAVHLARLVLLKDQFLASVFPINGAGGSTLLPVIFHRLLGTTDDITSGLARPRWATQRRRGAYGQSNIPPA